MAFRPKILIVESDPALCQQLESTMNLMGSEPRFIAAEQDVACQIDTEKFDGAFLDWDSLGFNP